MTNRLSKWSRHSSRMICLLAACGLMYACKDEFILDDEKPTWLNSSVYESLQSDGHFRTYLRLLADKDVNPEGARPLTDVLSRTGSKTVFVATDSAWNAFFAQNAKLPESNPWHYATSYENLSVAQKKLLIHTSMLNNAIVMENLASSESSGSSSPVRGEYMRRYTDIEGTDTITYVPDSELPKNYAVDETNTRLEKDYWARFREENGGNGLYMVTDSSLSMMLHFTSEHMTKNTVTDEDFKIFMGRERYTSDVHIYDAKLMEKDKVCENGYVNVTEKPLCPLSSMAEVIRVNGRTNIFSHMLDRFSAPFYSGTLTSAYKALHPEFSDSIFIKRYFSELSYGHKKLDSEPGDKGTYTKYNPYTNDQNADATMYLKLDPAWNGYYDKMDVRKDMAAMFVPNDEALMLYFTSGGGKQLIDTYYRKEGTDKELADYQVPTTYDELYQQIDKVPLGTIYSLINLIMMSSFTGSVPSKMTKLRDDAREQLFYPSDVEKIDTCLLASNGAVYIMNDVYGPADYTSVTAPAVISELNKIMKWAIYDQDMMSLNYYAYLKAMQSKFTLLLPSDKALYYDYDPTSMKSRTPRTISLTVKNAKDYPINARCYNYVGPYNSTKGEIGSIGTALQGNASTPAQSEVLSRLKDILESHTIVHDGTNPMTRKDADSLGWAKSQPLDEYFLSKNGNAIKVTRDENDKLLKIQGGFQLENERQGVREDVNPGVTQCGIDKWFDDQKNGHTYVMDAPLVPTFRSVYSIMTNDIDQVKDAAQKEEIEANNPYREFYNLCAGEDRDRLVMGCGLVDTKTLTSKEQQSALKKYKIFVDDKGLDYNIQFFNNYRYTIFVPNNEAVEAAVAAGLPTWQEIKEDFESHRKFDYEEVPAVDEDGNPILDEDGNPTYTQEIKRDDDGNPEYVDELLTPEDSTRIAAKITYLTNFIRYHFADDSEFVDKTEQPDHEMVTSSYDSEVGLFCKLHVDRILEGDKAVLRVADAYYEGTGNSRAEVVGTKQSVLLEKDGKIVYNILARDVSCSSSPAGQAMSNITLDASSAAVIHMIDNVLCHTKLENGRHDSKWATTGEAKRYLKRYAIK